VWRERPRRRQFEHLREWSAYILLGLLIGTVAFAMSTLEEWLSGYIANTTQGMIQVYGKTLPEEMGVIKPWLFFAGASGLCGLIAGIMTTYYG